MPTQRPISDPLTTGYATIRELRDVKDEILREMRVMKDEIMAEIKCSNEAHDATHDEMRRRADERHRLIDAVLLEDRLADATEAANLAGRSEVFRAIIVALRLLNEFRGLLAIVFGIIAAALFLANDLHVTIA